MKRPTTPATALPAVDIIWNSGTLEQWGRLLDKVARVPLTQTFEYGVAMSRCERLLPRLGIIKLSGKTLGVVQVLERRILGFIHVVQIHRGPLWLGAEPDGAVQQAFFAALRREFPRALTRWVSLMPELMAGHENEALVARSGFRKSGGKGYETIWLDLARSEQDLRRSLAGNWRNHLSGAERGPLIVDVSTEGRELPWLALRCAADQKARHYRGPSAQLAVRLRNVFYKQGGVLLLRAMLPPEEAGDEPEIVAGILVLRHHKSATWLIGWSDAVGRHHHAHTLLLWHAVLRLRALGTRWFDLGGINPEHAPGVTCFKRGLGGEEVALVGSFL